MGFFLFLGETLFYILSDLSLVHHLVPFIKMLTYLASLGAAAMLVVISYQIGASQLTSKLFVAPSARATHNRFLRNM